MRYVLLAATALVALAPAALAQITVIDPAVLIKDATTALNTAQEVENGYKQITAMVHGNGFAGLVPGLGSGLTANPLGTAGTSASSLMSGIGTGGGLSGLFNQFAGQVKTYQPTGNDPEAQMLQQRANAAAGQLAVAQQYLNGTGSRLSLLPQLANLVGGTADIKDAIDANTRVNTEQMTQGAQTAQLQALSIYQQAEQNAQRSREELAMRQGADELVSQAQTAATNAAAGNVTLVTH
jgi:Type IV secretion system proteins